MTPGFATPDQILSYISIWPLLWSILSCIMCMAFSATYHLFMVRSAKWNTVLSRLDYGGIAFTIFGCATPVIWYGFACSEVAYDRKIWLSVMGTLCGSCFIVSLLNKFASPKWRPVRAGLFIFAGLSNIAVFLAVCVNPSEDKIDFSVLWYGVAGGIFIFGACLYAARVPERCKKGAFDLCGASHQLFHFCVLIGFCLFFWQNFELFKRR